MDEEQIEMLEETLFLDNIDDYDGLEGIAYTLGIMSNEVEDEEAGDLLNSAGELISKACEKIKQALKRSQL